jgi:hypothetical protein
MRACIPDDRQACVRADILKKKRVARYAIIFLYILQAHPPHKAVAAFPYGVRLLLGTADAHYRANNLPVACDNVLHFSTPSPETPA